MHLVLVGLLPGVLLASWATRAFESSVLGLMPNDIPTWVVVSIPAYAFGSFFSTAFALRNHGRSRRCR